MVFLLYWHVLDLLSQMPLLVTFVSTLAWPSSLEGGGQAKQDAQEISERTSYTLGLLPRYKGVNQPLTYIHANSSYIVTSLGGRGGNDTKRGF